MNKIIPKLVLMLVLLMSAFGMNANPIDMRTAQEVAVKFMNANAKTPLRGTDDLQLVTTYNISRGDAAFYVFNTSNGFVIVSADDCATPILGYSDGGRPFDLDNIPIQLQDYLQGFVEQIQYGIENHVQDETTSQQWEMVRSVGHLIEQRGTTAVAPLLTDSWDQGCYYNAKCPEDPNGWCGHVLTGCVATSFAQIMHYWGYPTIGMGSHSYTPSNYPQQTANFGATTYDWANMPNSLSYSSTSVEIDAVATLIWHCGVAVNMQYSRSGSGANPFSVPSALVNYFGYSNELSLVSRNSYSDEDWLDLMKGCLDTGCPIHYSGWPPNSGNGHSFVCDGYNANNLLHFNWGWSGACDGYYSINAMNPDIYAYTSNNLAIINIRPPDCTSGTTYQITASTDPSDGGTVSGAGTYDCGNICTLTANAIGDYSFMYWAEEGEQVSSDASYSFIAMNDRNLVAHFGLSFNITTSTNPAEGGTVSGGGTCHYNQQVTLTATPNEGYVFNKWTKDGEVFSYLSTLNLTVTEAAEYVAYFEPMDGIVIGDATYDDYCLPGYFYNSLTQQIYTASEMGGVSTEISSVSFFNTGNDGGTRKWNVYMFNTDKTSFESNSDWIPVSENDLVFSGNIRMTAHSWATVYFDTPFLFDGSSNVALVVDNNSNNYNSSIKCRTFGTEDNQAIRIYGYYNSEYDPYNPSSYAGTLTAMKNQVVFGIPSYDYTVTATVGPEGGGTVSGGGLCYLNQPITLTAVPDEGYVFSYWTRNGTVVSCLPTHQLTVTASEEYVAHFELKPEGIVIGDAIYASQYLPVYNYNSLSEQIYTVDEMGGTASEIVSVSLFYTGHSNLTRNWDVYLVHTEKTSFTNTSDWIPVSGNDLVFSGNVTTTPHGWTTIILSTPFLYDGSSNVALVVDDNSNSYSNINCRTFGTEESQAIRISGSSGTDYDPINPSSYTGALMTEKNQIAFHHTQAVTVTANPVEGGVVSEGGIFAYGTTCTLTATPNAGYYFLNWTEDGEVVSYDAAYSFAVNSDRNLVANFVEGESTCTIVFDLHDSYHNGWSGNYLVVHYSDGSSEQFTLESGSSVSYSREVATGSTIALSWIEGTNMNQCSFDIKFDNDVPIYHGSSLNANFQHELYVNCAVATAPHTITVVVDPVEGGTVEGAGIYDGGTVITLTATPNAGYSFIHWKKENGATVSSNANYSFTVTSDRTLVAFFSLPLTISVTTNMAVGGTTTGAGTYDYGNTCTLTATPNEGYLFLNWSKNGEVVSCNATYSFTVTKDAEIEAVFMRLEGVLIGQGESTDMYLPINSNWKYTLSQQIYTPNEIGAAGSITSISYYNAGDTKTRNYDIYMVHTDKTAFNNNTDWIPVTEVDRVFRGNVVMTKGYWTTIVLDTPFAYDGTSNLVIVFDDNTGTYSYGMDCRVFYSQGYQAIHVYSDNTNYDPTNPSGYDGTRRSVKNQIILGITPSITQTVDLTAGWNWISLYVELGDPVEALRMFEAALGDNATVISASEMYTEYYGNDIWIGDLDEVGIANEQMYMVEVVNDCEVTLEGTIANPADHAITINPGWNWIGFPYGQELNLEDALADFEAEEGDQLTEAELYTEYGFGMWIGDVAMLVPGQGYMYYSNSTQPKTLVFPSTSKGKNVFLRKRK